MTNDELDRAVVNKTNGVYGVLSRVVTSAVRHGLKCQITAHGPIQEYQISSTTKRIASQLIAQIRQWDRQTGAIAAVMREHEWTTDSRRHQRRAALAAVRAKETTKKPKCRYCNDRPMTGCSVCGRWKDGTYGCTP
jgi:hypothetical protein